MNDSTRIHFLAGQVAALNAFAIALIKTHPDLEALQAEYATLTEKQVALSSPEPVSEAYLEGQQQTAAPLLALIATRRRL